MWKIPAEAIQSRNREAALRTIRNQVVDPEQLAADIDYLYEHAHETERKEVILKDGRILERYSAPVKSTEGEYYGRVWYFRDITDRKLAEEQLRASLREKEVLLREVHHRVKNNLQAISNLLYLQSEHIGSSQILAIFRETQDRVKSIALIHEKLYQSRDLSQIDFAEYVDSLATHLIHSYGRDRAVSLEVQVDDISIDVDAAIPLGVIINELVTNSLKHAFPAEKKGPDDPSNRVCIELRQGSGRVLVLTVGDNGVGFPPEMDISTTRSLGLQLVNTLSTHMKGTVDLKQNGGAVVKISFELPHRPKAI
jgi:two-component sensor histidine kinase